MLQAALGGTLERVEGKKIVKGGLYVVDNLPPSKKERIITPPQGVSRGTPGAESRKGLE